VTRIELTPDEAVLLHELLTAFLTDFRRQVAGTENPDFRGDLQRRQDFLEDFLRRLERLAA
jgi:hypothetical protein